MGRQNKFKRMMEVSRANGKPCAWCERRMDATSPDLMPTREHVHQRSQGGKWIVWACQTCNNIKADKTLQEWEAFMSTTPKWWMQRKGSIVPIAESRYILVHGKKAYKAAKAADYEFT